MSSTYWLGLEPGLGRDVFTQLIYGARTSLFIAFTAGLITTVVGVLYGITIGFLGGWVDSLGGRVMDIVFAFPSLLFIIAFSPVVESLFVSPEKETPVWLRFGSIIFLLSVLSWVYQARLIRGQVLSLREREFILAAEVIGVPTWKVLFKELLPNLVAPIVVSISLGMPAFVAAEAGLSFLGLGLTGTPSLGKMVADATPYYADYALYLWLPVGAIALLTLSLNLLGDAVRDAFDPKTRR
jgi:peptide/nickel transport system permease protein